MRTLKFKPLTVYVFRCRQSSKRISWQTEAHFSRLKRSRLLVVIVSVFQGSLAVTIIMIDGSEKPNRQLGFELQSSHVTENRNKQQGIKTWVALLVVILNKRLAGLFKEASIRTVSS